MKTFSKAVILLLGATTLLLAACDGEGWEVIQVRGQVPYTEERTAGPGVAYVRAHLLPAKMVILPETPMMAPPSIAEKIFDQKMMKK